MSYFLFPITFSHDLSRNSFQLPFFSHSPSTPFTFLAVSRDDLLFFLPDRWKKCWVITQNYPMTFFLVVKLIYRFAHTLFGSSLKNQEEANVSRPFIYNVNMKESQNQEEAIASSCLHVATPMIICCRSAKCFMRECR